LVGLQDGLPTFGWIWVTRVTRITLGCPVGFATVVGWIAVALPTHTLPTRLPHLPGLQFPLDYSWTHGFAFDFGFGLHLPVGFPLDCVPVVWLLPCLGPSHYVAVAS